MFSALLLAATLVTLDDDGARSTQKTDLEAYESRPGRDGQDADAQVRLALWCEAHGMPAERLKHLGLAVSDNSSHALARTIGPSSYDSEWKSPDQLTSELADDVARKARVDEYLARRARCATAPTSFGSWLTGASKTVSNSKRSPIISR